MVTYIAKEDITTVLRIIPKGSIFSVRFTKKDGSERLMVCRQSVTKYLAPNPTKKKVEVPNHVTVFDMKAKGYRMFNLDTTAELHACHTEFIIQKEAA